MPETAQQISSNAKWEMFITQSIRETILDEFVFAGPGNE